MIDGAVRGQIVSPMSLEGELVATPVFLLSVPRIDHFRRESTESRPTSPKVNNAQKAVRGQIVSPLCLEGELVTTPSVYYLYHESSVHYMHHTSYVYYPSVYYMYHESSVYYPSVYYLYQELTMRGTADGAVRGQIVSPMCLEGALMATRAEDNVYGFGNVLISPDVNDQV